MEREEVEVSKTPEVKEEFVARKTPNTETHRVIEELKGETVHTTGAKNMKTTKSDQEEEE